MYDTVFALGVVTFGSEGKVKRQECRLIIDVYPVMWEQSEPLSFPLTTSSWGPQANGPHAIDSKMPYHKEGLCPLVNRQGLGEKEQ